MKKIREKIIPFPSSFHISNEGEKKKPTSTPLPLPLNSKKNKKSRRTPSS
jgi:hypothetical protein